MELHRASGRHGLGLALAATTMLLWGALPLALEIVLGGLDAATTVWVRFLFAAVVLGGVLASRGRLRGLARLGPTGWLQLGVATLFLALNYFAYVVGLDLTNAASAQVLLQLAPLLLALGGIVVFREHFSRLQWLGFAVLVVGLGVFFLDQVRSLVAEVGRYLWGAGVLVLAAVTWAVYGLFQKQLLRRLSSQQIMVGIYTGCALGFLPFARPAALTSLDAVQLAALAFCALNTVVAYGAFSEALAHWEATRVSSVLALTPLATLGFVALGSRLAPGWVESEPVSATGLVGAAVVVAGSLLAALGGTPQTAAGAD
jgi:drug/metabolite transporter (DMT)-like permease